MALSCQKCGAPFQREDLHPDEGYAECGFCGTLWRLPERDGKVRQRPLAPLPSSITPSHGGGLLRWRVRRFKTMKVGDIAPVVGIPVFVIAVLLYAGEGSKIFSAASAAVLALPVVVALLFVGAALWLALAATHVVVGNNAILVSHNFEFWRKANRLETGSIKQLYTVHTRTGSNAIPTRYDVVAVLESGEHVTLFESLDTHEQAFYLEQEIENFLGIPPGVVEGELS